MMNQHKPATEYTCLYRGGLPLLQADVFTGEMFHPWVFLRENCGLPQRWGGSVTGYIAQVHGVMACIIVVYIVMAYIVMAYIVIAYIVMAYIVMAPGVAVLLDTLLRSTMRSSIHGAMSGRTTACSSPVLAMDSRPMRSRPMLCSPLNRGAMPSHTSSNRHRLSHTRRRC